MNEQKTELEQVLEADWRYQWIRGASAKPEEIQAGLDSIAPEICAKVGPNALVTHTWVIQERTADEYNKNPDHRYIPDGLLSFMGYLKDGAYVLDLGCGTGRDAIFMALRDAEKRKKFMERTKDGKKAWERFGVPEKAFHVTGIDNSYEMMAHASVAAQAHGFETGYGDRSRLPSSVRFAQCMDMYHLRADRLQTFDGVWSSAALFMHTPRELIRPAFENVARVLHSGGIFGVSYANNSAGLPYDNLRYSRTGEIKYFSRPTFTEVASAAERSGFLVREEQLSDFEMGDVVKKNFFVTQFFQKQ